MCDKIKTTFDIDAAIDGMTPNELDRGVAEVVEECYHEWKWEEPPQKRPAQTRLELKATVVAGFRCVKCRKWGRLLAKDHGCFIKPTQEYSSDWGAFGRALEWFDSEYKAFYVEFGRNDIKKHQATIYEEMDSSYGNLECWVKYATGLSRQEAFCKALIKLAVATGKITAERIKEICA